MPQAPGEAGAMESNGPPGLLDPAAAAAAAKAVDSDGEKYKTELCRNWLQTHTCRLCAPAAPAPLAITRGRARGAGVPTALFQPDSPH